MEWQESPEAVEEVDIITKEEKPVEEEVSQKEDLAPTEEEAQEVDTVDKIPKGKEKYYGI